jgi:hypothetical protein
MPSELSAPPTIYTSIERQGEEMKEREEARKRCLKESSKHGTPVIT